MAKKTHFKLILGLILSLFMIGTSFAATYNQDGDFIITIDKQSQKVINDNINAEFSFNIKNNKNFAQRIQLNLSKKSGWNIDADFDSFNLAANEEKTITIRYSANSNFDYSTDVSGPDVIKIYQVEDYKGYFSFPVKVIGEGQTFDFEFKIDVDKKEKIPVTYQVKFSTNKLSPVSPLGYSITALNLEETQEVEIKVELGETTLGEFKTTFDPKNNFKVFQEEVLSSISPGNYNAKVTVRHPQEGSNLVSEWNGNLNLNVNQYTNMPNSSSLKKTFFSDTYIIDIKNEGNIESEYSQFIELSFLKLILGSSKSGSENYVSEIDGGIEIKTIVARGEFVQIIYKVNYIPVYIIFLVSIFLASYMYYRKNSNPLDIETSIYDVKTVRHEGVKSLKLRIGFENIKEHEIELIKLTFRMPSYLNVKENSFLLSEPNHVLRGQNQYKLIWNFKKFEKNDSRIIGFVLINKKGILGDLKLPDLEIEVKSKGKIRKYYNSFPIIKG
ncbi:MAG: hypothetical protein KC550_00780 [Nanoarchaeota archaeon]|nr:hypothetical protein [Nanoarchaeota archaeon]